ncbi:3547_t:CDS:2 [Paraglomus occultum]|uniref:3547_t:CDS:1 n=1 Tax=Paraglomus occultum TaxID=144539 RepID=A0A9N8W844_9GLOM|nr:3547_t:CDS:2 [Paraglomus occultum]
MSEKRKKLEELAAKRKAEQTDEINQKQTGKVKPKPQAQAQQKHKAVSSGTSAGSSSKKTSAGETMRSSAKPVAVPPRTNAFKPKPYGGRRLNEDAYDEGDGFVVEDDEDEITTSSSDSENYTSEPSDSDEAASKKRKKSSSTRSRKKIKGKPKKKVSSDDDSDGGVRRKKKLKTIDDEVYDSDEIKQDAADLDASNIIKGGRRTRGKKIDFSVFGPDPEDE